MARRRRSGETSTGLVEWTVCKQRKGPCGVGAEEEDEKAEAQEEEDAAAAKEEAGLIRDQEQQADGCRGPTRGWIPIV